MAVSSSSRIQTEANTSPPASPSSTTSEGSKQATVSNSGSARKRRKVTRSKTGCLCCRKRRKKCDMSKPECGACKRLHMTCQWPMAKSHSARSSLNANTDGGDVWHDESTRTTSMATVNVPNISIDGTAEQTTVDGLMALLQDTPPQRLQPMVNTPNSGFSSAPLAMPQLSASLSPGQVTMNNNAFNTDLFPFDDGLLQMWAADCLPSSSSTQTTNAFGSLNELLFPSLPVQTTLPDVQPAAELESPLSQGSESHTAMLRHYRESLSTLVSCSNGEHAPNAFDEFTNLANANITSPAGQGLHLSILAWAGRHMVNQGQLKYEAVSERLSLQASKIIMDKLEQQSQGQMMQEKELMTLFAGVLMLMQFKICRGDVWGFDTFVDHLRTLSKILFSPERSSRALSSTEFQLFENLIYHDTVSSSLLINGPIVPEASLLAFVRPHLETLQTLTGVSLEAFCIMQRIAALIRSKRLMGSAWDDDFLSTIMSSVTDIENDLEREKQRLDASVRAKPHFESHRYFHEAVRIACLLQLRCFILCNSPSSINVRLLVRKSLSLLEAMSENELPGFCSAHWVIFTTAVCAAEGGQPVGEPDDRQRIGKLYDMTINTLAFLNTSRSRKIVGDLWSRNQGGSISVDWLDILAEYDWEIFFA